MRTRFRRHEVLLVGAALALAACASDASEDAAPSDPAAPPSSDGVTAPDASAILEALHPSRGEPPTELQVVDLTEGDGAAVAPGDTVEVHYWGLRWSDGGTFDASWNRGRTFAFVLGAGEVIRGWDVGVEGMRAGGRRVLVIPPDLGYGDRGAGGVIGPGETLVFVVDLVGTR